MKRLGCVVPLVYRCLDTARLSGLVQRAETLGYEVAFTTEGWGYDTTCLLTRCALETSTIKIGSAIVPVEPRTPAQIAMAAVTIDDASKGRLVLGLGMGHRDKEENWHGLEYRPSVGRLGEYVQIIREAVSGREMAFNGEHLKSNNYALEIDPVRRTIPIYLAALGFKTHRLVGRIADGVLAYYAPPGRIEKFVEVIRESAQAAGRDPADVDIGLMIPTVVTDDPGPAREQVRREMAWYNNFDNYRNMFREAGFREEADALEAAWGEVRRRDPEMIEWNAAHGNDCGTAQHVSDEMLDSILVAGTAAECHARIEGFRDLGVDLPIVFPQGSFEDASTAVPAIERTLAGARTGEDLEPGGQVPRVVG